MLQKSFGMMCWLACIMGVGVIPSLDQGCIVRDSRVALIIVNKRRGARARSGGRISSNSSPVNPMPKNAIIEVPKTSEIAEHIRGLYHNTRTVILTQPSLGLAKNLTDKLAWAMRLCIFNLTPLGQHTKSRPPIVGGTPNFTCFWNPCAILSTASDVSKCTIRRAFIRGR